MNKKVLSKTNSKIVLITVIVTTLGLFYPLMVLFQLMSHAWVKNLTEYVSILSPNLGLEYFVQNLFTRYQGRYPVNEMDFCVYQVLFFGLIAYLISKGREIRLIRMIFGVILMTQVLSFFYVAILLLCSNNAFRDITSGTLFFLSTLTWIYLSFFVLKKLSANKNLAEKGRLQETDNLAVEYVETPKIQRFTHLIIDSFLSILIVSKYLRPWLKDWQGELMGSIALLLVIIISGLVYYVFFETIFGATPAKFLTESKILKRKESTKINLTNALLRNLIRYIPFETLSYLGNADGWHDKWANTRVVKEERHGVKTKHYLWFIPIFLIATFLFGMAVDTKRKSDRDKYEQGQYDKKIERIIEYTQNLPTTHFIEIDGVEYGVGDYFLKAEHITDDSVSFSYFDKDYSLWNGRTMEKYYKANKNNLEVTKISRAALSNSYTIDFKDYEGRNRNGIRFLPSTDRYEIVKIYPAGAPYIRLGRSQRYGGETIINLVNDGWNANLIAIDNIEGDLKWSNSLPQKIENTVALIASNPKREKSYKFTFTIVDSLNREKKYLIKRTDNQQTMEEL